MAQVKIALTNPQPKKHSVRYDAPGDITNPAISTLYVSKSALGDSVPSQITVTVEWGG